MSLKKGITSTKRQRWLKASPLEWAQESYDIATKNEVDYCEWTGDRCTPEGNIRTLTVTYQDRFRDDVELRLQQAAVRLAGEIRKVLE